MIGREFRFHDGEKGAALAIRITQDKASTGIVKVLKDGILLINLPQKDVDIDNELINYLSKTLDIEKRRLDIIAGSEENERLVSIIDMKPSQVQEIVLENIDR
jgi:uncharacterized protein YggU (UPF0235/DUF167 family)